jgi:8-amino-7-oxononanoate synthase
MGPARADDDALTAWLEGLGERGLLRQTREVTGPQGASVVLDGRRVLLLCSNDYRDLADHPRVREAAVDAIGRWGLGAGASRLVSGTMEVHRRLEDRLAEFKGAEAALLFGSGYLANVGVLSALAGDDTVVFSDELNHASIVDGCRLARARVVVYRHADLEHLGWELANAGDAGRLIVTDSVFSMDGDLAPLAGIVELARRHGARVVVDEAHGTGCLGPGGRGAVHAAGLEAEVDVVVGTLGKALGCYGAYVTCGTLIARALLNAARPFIFSTALPPPVAAGALAALEVLADEPWRVASLQANAALLRAELAARGLGRSASTTHIVPLIVGDPDVAVRTSELALEGGVFAQAIRPPTVPQGTSRLRLAVMATHTGEDLAAAARILADAAGEAGFAPRATGAALTTQPSGW